MPFKFKMIISNPDINQARKLIQQAKKNNETIIVKAQDEEFNKKILEHPFVNILLSPEIHSRKDKSKQRDSGLNEHLAKLAKSNNKTIAIDLESLQKLDKKNKSRVLARIKQNIKLCKRTGTKIILWPKNIYSKQDSISFFTSLKGTPGQGKTAFN